MKTKILLIVVMVCLFFTNSYGAFGLPGIGKGSSKPAGDPDSYLAKAKATEELVNKSADLLFALVGSKEAQAKIEELQKKLAGTTKPEEQKAIMQEKRDSQMAEISRAAGDKKLEAEAKEWGDQKKKQGAAALFNMGLGALLAKDLVPEGQNIAKSLQSNPTMLGKAATILESVKTLGGIVTGTGKVITAVPPVFSAAKIDVVLPKTTAEKEKAADL